MFSSSLWKGTTIEYFGISLYYRLLTPVPAFGNPQNHS
jgi:hypothetical protein